MKPIIAMACMMLGTTSMATMIYMATNPDAFLSHSPRVKRHTDSTALARAVSQTQTVVAVTPRTIQIEPIHITGRNVRTKPVSAKPATEDSALSACSDWRALGPSANDAGSVSGGHQVKLLCPSGANVQDTFLVGMQRSDDRKLR